jgi:hypothetical protein
MPDPEVVGVAAQPMWLHWTHASGRGLRQAPDHFARRADGTGVVIDVRPDQRIGDRDAAVFAAPRGFARRWAGSMSGSVSWTRSMRRICAGWRATGIRATRSRR